MIRLSDIGAARRAWRIACGPAARICACILLLALQSLGAGAAGTYSPFDRLAGRWVGEGRLGLREGGTETVKCRVTYFVEDAGRRLRQNIRCASSAGSIEVASAVLHSGGALTGSWKETTRNMNGEMSGVVHDNGFKVMVKGADLTANMDIIVKDARQIIEIQFNSSALIGLTLILTKG